MAKPEINPDFEKPKRRRSLAGKAKDEPNPAWRRFFMEVDNRRKALSDKKKKPLVVCSYEKDGKITTIARQKSEPTELKKLLKRQVKKSAMTRLGDDLDWLREVWAKIVGNEVASCSEVYAFKNGVVTITVFSSTLLQEIRQFHQEAILYDLRDIWQASIPLVKITYRIGKAQS